MPKYLSLFEKLLFLLLMILVVAIPLYPKIPFINIPGTFVAIRLEDLLIGLCLFSLLSYLTVAKKLKSFLSDKIIQAFLLFFFIGGLSVFSGFFLTHTIKLHLGALHFLRRIEVMMLLPFAYYSVRNLKDIKYLGWVSLIVVTLVDIYALGQQFLAWPVISTTNSEFSKGLILKLSPGARVNSTFAGHYDLAVFLMIFLVFSVPLIFQLKRFKTKIILLSVQALSLVILIMTAARFSFVALLAGVLFSLFLSGKKMLIGLTILAAVAALIIPSPLQNRFLSTINVLMSNNSEKYVPSNMEEERGQLNIPTLPAPEATLSATQSATPSGVASDIAPGEPTDYSELTVYRSFGIRFNYEWPQALRAFYKNPLLGTGYSSLGVATDNDFLRSLGESGLLGSLALVLVFLVIIKQVRRKRSALSIATLSVVAAFLLNGVFIDVLESSKVASIFWLLIGVFLGFEKNNQ